MLALALLLLVAAVPSAQACSVTAGTLAFGSIDPLSGLDTTSTSTISVTCPAPTNYTLGISSGQSGVLQRRMSAGSDTLEYQLFVDASHNTVWGDGAGMGVTVSGSADANGASHIVYGRLPSQPQARAGFYVGTLVVTATF